MYNMSDYEVSAESVLLNHGGLENKDLVKLVNNDPINDDYDEIDAMSYSPFFLPSNLPNLLTNSKSSFGILSLNAGSLSAKFNSLQVLLKSLSYQNIRFPCEWYVFRSLGSQTNQCSNYFNQMRITVFMWMPQPARTAV